MFISLIKQQFVVTHTMHQTSTSAQLDSSVKNTPSVKILYPNQKVLKCWFFKELSSFFSLLENCIGELRQTAVQIATS